MSDRQTFVLISERIRRNAIQAILTANDGYVVRVAPPTRSVDQNAFFHAICGDIAKSPARYWAGKPRDADEWKVLLVSGHTKATAGDVEIVPGIENEFVNIRESTARMSVARAGSLIEYALAWCANHGVELTETRRQGFVSENELPGGSGNAAPADQLVETNPAGAANPYARMKG
jgi:hypothetical protein